MNIAIISLGCPKNQVDADVFCHALLKAGHQTVADPAEADVIIINTCGFIQSAKEEAIENILMACQYKRGNPGLKVIVTGCLAERYKSEIMQEMPEVDAVVGIGSNAALPAIVDRLTSAGACQLESYGPKREMPLGGARVISTPRHYAYLKIAEGCNNRCHYCAIPLIRGPLRSRPLEDCVAEARWLAGEGVRELILVAQDPTAYGEDWGQPGAVCALLDRLNAIEGIRWIRVLYAYPERISDEFIAAMVRNNKVVPYLDLPIQHCDDTILKHMNRRGGRRDIEDAVARLRAAIPGITLRTTLIAGFPGETEEQYSELCDFVKTVRFDRLGCFAYSAEENTVAARMDNQIAEDVKQRRADHIMELQAQISAEKQAEKVGATLECVCDGVDEETGMYLLRSKADCPEIDGNVLTPADTPLETGAFYRVTVTDSDTYDLYGYAEEKLED
ncbi:30S ribosomal protein S12 methylthiotransferase RimO [bacterium]|nr:30S ribosomal protein S12 methylthiotransferase RimO [bacterium]MCI7745043.1 30S ribosomal protein S12 methylthiotransferase RimO [bacterium]